MQTIFGRKRKNFPDRAFALAFVYRGTTRYVWFRTSGEREEYEADAYERYRDHDILDPETIYYLNIRKKGLRASPRHHSFPFRHRYCRKQQDAHVRLYRLEMEAVAERLRLEKSEKENERIAALYTARLNDRDYSAHLRTRIEWEHAKRWGYEREWRVRNECGRAIASVDENRRKNPWEIG